MYFFLSWFYLLLFIYLSSCTKNHRSSKVSTSHHKYDLRCDVPQKIPLIVSPVNTARMSYFRTVFDRIDDRGGGQFLFLGGSITAQNYFSRFSQHLKNDNISVINRGQGASDVTYFIYCVDLHDIQPDIIFIDFKINDPDVTPSVLETFIRKIITLNKSEKLQFAPLIVLVNFSKRDEICSTQLFGQQIAKHYSAPIIDLCRHINYCFGGGSDLLWALYSKDSVHPSGPKAESFIGDTLWYWYDTMYKQAHRSGVKPLSSHDRLPKRIYKTNSTGMYKFCECLNDHAAYGLYPVENNGFDIITRTKVGKLSFQSTKRCWESATPGSSITFQFQGTHLIVVVYQKNKDMGMIEVKLDNETHPSHSINLYFEGYHWSRVSQGRQYAYPLFANLTDILHTVTFIVSNQSSCPDKPGHSVQIIALLYSTNFPYLPFRAEISSESENMFQFV